MRPPIECWNISAELRPLTGGHRNLVFATKETQSGQGFIFKSTRRSEAAIEWLSPVHQVAETAGFLVPKFIKSRQGNLIENGWTCETYIVGAQVTSTKKTSILPMIEAFHEKCAGLPQRPDFRSSTDLIEYERGGDVDLQLMPASLAAKCREAWSAVANGNQSVIHGDLSASNLIRTPDGRTAIIDWDECRRDLVLFDRAALSPSNEAHRQACLAWEVACSWRIEPEYARHMAKKLQGSSSTPR